MNAGILKIVINSTVIKLIGIIAVAGTMTLYPYNMKKLMINFFINLNNLLSMKHLNKLYNLKVNFMKWLFYLQWPFLKLKGQCNQYLHPLVFHELF